MAVTLVDLLDERNVVLDLRSRRLETALREIIHLLSANGKIDNQAAFLEQVLARERANPTVTEYGVVFPHARTDLVNEIVLGIGRSRTGIRFADHRRAQLLFVIGVPRQFVNDYLIALGALARLVADDLIRTALLEAETPAHFIRTLKSNL
jgi:mannitol/fructose-specific phosphotransferase system IIA component (Ntr-type)